MGLLWFSIPNYIREISCIKITLADNKSGQIMEV